MAGCHLTQDNMNMSCLGIIPNSGKWFKEKIAGQNCIWMVLLIWWNSSLNLSIHVGKWVWQHTWQYDTTYRWNLKLLTNDLFTRNVNFSWELRGVLERRGTSNYLSTLNQSHFGYPLGCTTLEKEPVISGPAKAARIVLTCIDRSTKTHVLRCSMTQAVCLAAGWYQSARVSQAAMDTVGHQESVMHLFYPKSCRYLLLLVVRIIDQCLYL